MSALDGQALFAVVWRFTFNCNRCNALLRAADAMPDLETMGSTLPDDLRRAAVVLSHAALEDLLRSLAEIRLPHGDPKLLEKIPLLADEKAKNPTLAEGNDGRTPCNLARLSLYRDESVEEVIQRSVIAYLAYKSYNSLKDVADALDQIGVLRILKDADGSQLSAMMTRRNHIAHRADRKEGRGEGDPMSRGIDSETVRGWIDAVSHFGTKVLDAVLLQPTEEG